MASIVLRLWVYMACFFLVVKISTAWGYSSWWTQFTTEDWLNSATLKNYLFGYSDSVNGVLWYLFTLLLSFALYIPFSAFTERKRIAPVYVLFSDIAIVIMTLFGTFPGLKLLSPYIGIFLTGFIIAMMFNREQGDGSLRTSVVLLMVNIAVTVFAFRETYYDTYYSTQPYLVSVVSAVLVFVICLQCADKFKKNPVITFLSNISYPFYVQHSLYGGFIIGYLYFMNIFPYTVLFLLGVGGSIVTASLSIYVESKVHNVFAKSLKKEGKKNYE